MNGHILPMLTPINSSASSEVVTLLSITVLELWSLPRTLLQAATKKVRVEDNSDFTIQCGGCAVYVLGCLWFLWEVQACWAKTITLIFLLLGTNLYAQRNYLKTCWGPSDRCAGENWWLRWNGCPCEKFSSPTLVNKYRDLVKRNKQDSCPVS